MSWDASYLIHHPLVNTWHRQRPILLPSSGASVHNSPLNSLLIEWVEWTLPFYSLIRV